jgi:D-methionine transport system substrate-binding protein
MRRIALVFLTLLVIPFALAACGDDEEPAPAAASTEPLRVGVTPVPHAEILQYVKDELAPEAGLELEIEEFSDYVQPNTALDDGQLDANYFQTPAYMEDQAEARGIDLQSVVGVHIEPLGIYSRQVESLDQLEPGAQVALANDPANEARGLRLLEASGLIELRRGSGETATPRDVEENPKDLEFTEVEAAQAPRSLDDVELAVINGNYALEADLEPADDALALESAKGNPNANLLVTLDEKRDDPRIQELAELLTSPQVERFIERRYQGAVIPAF